MVERSRLAWGGSLLEGLFVGTATGTVAFDLNVIDRRSKDVAYQVRVRGDVELQSAQTSIGRDLKRLTVEEFRHEYGISDEAVQRRKVPWHQRARMLIRLALLPWGTKPKAAKSNLTTRDFEK